MIVMIGTKRDNKNVAIYLGVRLMFNICKHSPPGLRDTYPNPACHFEYEKVQILSL